MPLPVPNLHRLVAATAAVAAPAIALAQQPPTSSRMINPISEVLLAVSGWTIIAGVAAFCVMGFALQMFPGLHRE